MQTDKVVINISEEHAVFRIDHLVIIAGEFVQYLALRQQNPPHCYENALQCKEPLEGIRRGTVKNLVLELVNGAVNLFDGRHISGDEIVSNFVKEMVGSPDRKST